MGGVDAALHGLQIVALLRALGNETAAVRDLRPLERGQGWLQSRWAHVDPDNVTQLHAGIGLELDLLAEPALLGLRRNFDALSGDVVFPAVIGAAQPVLLIAAEPQRHAAMGTELVDDADLALRVAENDQSLGHQLETHRRTVS